MNFVKSLPKSLSQIHGEIGTKLGNSILEINLDFESGNFVARTPF